MRNGYPDEDACEAYHGLKKWGRELPGRMTNDEYPMTNEVRIPNDERITHGGDDGIDGAWKYDLPLPRTPSSSFGLRHSFVIGYFVIRH